MKRFLSERRLFTFALVVLATAYLLSGWTTARELQALCCRRFPLSCGAKLAVCNVGIGPETCFIALHIDGLK